MHEKGKIRSNDDFMQKKSMISMIFNTSIDSRANFICTTNLYCSCIWTKTIAFEVTGEWDAVALRGRDIYKYMSQFISIISGNPNA